MADLTGTNALKAWILAPGRNALPLAIKDAAFNAAFGDYWDDPDASDDDLPKETSVEVYALAPFVTRGVTLRANAVRNMPWVLHKGETEFDTSANFTNAAGFMQNFSTLLWLIEAGLTLTGKAYIFRERNRVRTLKLRWLVASTVTPKLDPAQGLIGFTRAIARGPHDLEVTDLLYFWLPDPLVEVGPPTAWPVKAALAAANVTLALDAFVAAFFKRGAIKATVLTVEGNAQAAEREKLKAWWGRALQGIKNAFATEVVNAVVKPVIIGEGVAELANQSLTQQAREDIAVALGIPLSLLLSSSVSGLGGGGVAEQDDIHFYDKTIIPECVFIAQVLNEQLFTPMGLHFAFLPETLDLYQKDETERAASLAQLTGAGIPLVLALQMLGFELPEGWDWDRLQGELDNSAGGGWAQQKGQPPETLDAPDVIDAAAAMLEPDAPAAKSISDLDAPLTAALAELEALEQAAAEYRQAAKWTLAAAVVLPEGAADVNT